MNDISVIDELKKVDIKIMKKMFAIAKIEEVKNPPKPLQFKILNYLLNNRNNLICQRDLEKDLNVSKATISEVLLTMEKGNMIKRYLSEKDSRSKIIKLTDESINKFYEMKNISTKLNEKLVDNISKNDLSIFFKVIEKMKENLDKI